MGSHVPKMGSHVPKMGPHCWCFRQQKASGYLPCTVQSVHIDIKTKFAVFSILAGVDIVHCNPCGCEYRTL